MAGNHRVMKVEHREGGATSLFDERPLRHQFQLLLCCIDTVLADRDVSLANIFREGSTRENASLAAERVVRYSVKALRSASRSRSERSRRQRT